MATKTAARQLASRQLRYGHFVESSRAAWVDCPTCRIKVRAEHLPWEKPSPALRTALTAHIAAEH